MMFLQKLSHFLTQKALGKELSMALMLLQLIGKSFEIRNMVDLAHVVYDKLPVNWRQPKGPATEAEFVEMVQAGQTFLNKVQAVLKPENQI
jgi:hypothetical protein